MFDPRLKNSNGHIHLDRGYAVEFKMSHLRETRLTGKHQTLSPEDSGTTMVTVFVVQNVSAIASVGR